MKYYSVAFFYPGPRSNSGEDHEASKVASAAEREVHNRLKSLGCEARHEYSWPDGTLYLYVKTDMSGSDLQSKFGEDKGIRIRTVQEIQSEEKPESYGIHRGKTIAQIFTS